MQSITTMLKRRAEKARKRGEVKKLAKNMGGFTSIAWKKRKLKIMKRIKSEIQKRDNI